MALFSCEMWVISKKMGGDLMSQFPYHTHLTLLPKQVFYLLIVLVSLLLKGSPKNNNNRLSWLEFSNQQLKKKWPLISTGLFI